MSPVAYDAEPWPVSFSTEDAAFPTPAMSARSDGMIMVLLVCASLPNSLRYCSATRRLTALTPPSSLMAAATVLTAFNDNAAITYLATLVPGFTDSLKYAVVAGAVAGFFPAMQAAKVNPVEALRAETDRLQGFGKFTFIIDSGGPPVGRPVTLRVVGSDDAKRQAG